MPLRAGRGAAIALVAALAGPSLAFAQPETDDVTEGALFLLLPVGAQGVGSGRAMTALPSEEAASGTRPDLPRSVNAARWSIAASS